MTDTTAQGPTADLFDHVAACIRQGHATDAMAANVEFLKGEFLRAFRSIDDAVAERTDELRFENSIWSDRIDELTAERNAMEARARESALDALAAYGQAAEAHTAQLAAEARLAELEAALQPSYFGSLVVLARASAEKASRKFPQPNYVTLKIAEEAGEVVRGAVHYAEGRMEWSEVEGEIVQLLAMLIRFVTEGDHVNGIIPPADLADRVKGGEV